MRDPLIPIPTTLDAATPRRLFLPPETRLLTRADCETLFKRIVAMTTGGGDTSVSIRSTWATNLRWARNRPTTSGDVNHYQMTISREIDGKFISIGLNQLDDASVQSAVRTVEDALAKSPSTMNRPLPMLPQQEYVTPTCWNEATFQMRLQDLSDVARASVDPVVDAKLDAAGYVEVGAASWAIFNTRGLEAYATVTGALYIEAVRNEAGTGSGWAGKSHTDWAKLDVHALSSTALEKCRTSINPVKLEPGRYTTILEPKAVAVFMFATMERMNRRNAESNPDDPFSLDGSRSKIGLRIFDERITITSDPADPECSYIPFDPEGNPYRKVNWVENGILKELPYDRDYARHVLHTDVVLPNPLAFRVSGGQTSVEEMITSTERGIYVTHFGHVYDDGEPKDLGQVGMTRDGLWLIEHGKITQPIKNMWMHNSPLSVFNQVLQLGSPARCVGVQLWEGSGVVRELPTQAVSDGYIPIVVPPMKVSDFNFTRLSDAI